MTNDRQMEQTYRQTSATHKAPFHYVGKSLLTTLLMRF